MRTTMVKTLSPNECTETHYKWRTSIICNCVCTWNRCLALFILVFFLHKLSMTNSAYDKRPLKVFCVFLWLSECAMYSCYNIPHRLSLVREHDLCFVTNWIIKSFPSVILFIFVIFVKNQLHWNSALIVERMNDWLFAQKRLFHENSITAQWTVDCVISFVASAENANFDRIMSVFAL